MRKLYLLFVVALALALSTAAFAQDNSVTIDLEEQNDSGVSGTATLTDNGDGTTTVTLDLEGTTEGKMHPAHIHAGSCPDVGAVVFPLEDVDGDTGESTTTVEADLATIMSEQHAINVHLGPGEDIDVYVACGDIPMEDDQQGDDDQQAGGGDDDQDADDDQADDDQDDMPADMPDTGAGGMAGTNNTAAITGLALVGAALAGGALVIARARNS